MQHSSKVATLVSAVVAMLVGTALALAHVHNVAGELIVAGVFTIGAIIPRHLGNRGSATAHDPDGSSGNSSSKDSGSQLFVDIALDGLRALCAGTFLYLAARLAVAALQAGRGESLLWLARIALLVAFPFAMPVLASKVQRNLSAMLRWALRNPKPAPLVPPTEIGRTGLTHFLGCLQVAGGESGLPTRNHHRPSSKLRHFAPAVSSLSVGPVAAFGIRGLQWPLDSGGSPRRTPAVRGCMNMGRETHQRSGR